MKASPEFITFFISCVFALMGVFNYFLADNIWPPLFIVSFIALLATIGIDVIERLHIEKRVNQLLDDERLPHMFRRQAD